MYLKEVPLGNLSEVLSEFSASIRFHVLWTTLSEFSFCWVSLRHRGHLRKWEARRIDRFDSVTLSQCWHNTDGRTHMEGVHMGARTIVWMHKVTCKQNCIEIEDSSRPVEPLIVSKVPAMKQPMCTNCDKFFAAVSSWLVQHLQLSLASFETSPLHVHIIYNWSACSEFKYASKKRMKRMKHKNISTYINT